MFSQDTSTAIILMMLVYSHIFFGDMLYKLSVLIIL